MDLQVHEGPVLDTPSALRGQRQPPTPVLPRPLREDRNPNLPPLLRHDLIEGRLVYRSDADVHGPLFVDEVRGHINDPISPRDVQRLTLQLRRADVGRHVHQYSVGVVHTVQP